ncbi:uncharacterized protein B0T23DRAFT_313684 [Neurospora hispaniola]|uniref:Uncharacterized protein n=1 Tax=Neurospora hispaniola TaxID=588809 RepID=A0AAJ0IB81_9PEZI|nr:hypothetical protein B0T23DRAFT_313684 [Neurospora hispaniola]
METNKSSGSQRPAENSDQSPSEVHYVNFPTLASHKLLLQEPLTPEELQAIENGALPGTYEELVALSSQFPNIHEMFNRIVIDHNRGYENISVSSMSTASASHQAVVAPEALGPATVGHLSQSLASPAGHSIAESNTFNQSPRSVQVKPPIVSQDTCNGLYGRGGCKALV